MGRSMVRVDRIPSFLTLIGLRQRFYFFELSLLADFGVEELSKSGH
jgi:hypothetical protein